MYKPKYLGGVGLPNAYVYYQAAILEKTRYWFSCQTDDRWSEIEQEITPGHDLPALAMAACVHHRPKSPLYPTIQASIAAWSSMLDQPFTDTPMQDIKTPFAAYEYLIPNFSTQAWKKKGDRFFTPDLEGHEALDSSQLFQIKHYNKSNIPRPLKISQILWN